MAATPPMARVRLARGGARVLVDEVAGRARLLLRPRSSGVRPSGARIRLVDVAPCTARRSAARRPRRAGRRRGSSSGARRAAGSTSSYSSIASSISSIVGALPDHPHVARLALEAGEVREHPAERRRRRCAIPGRCCSRRSSRSSLPSSRSCITATAVKVFVIEPMRYCVSGGRLDAALVVGRARPRPTRRSRRRERRPRRATAAARPGASGGSARGAARGRQAGARTSRAAGTSSIARVDVVVVDVEVRDRAQDARAHRAAEADARRRRAAGSPRPR